MSSPIEPPRKWITPTRKSDTISVNRDVKPSAASTTSGARAGETMPTTPQNMPLAMMENSDPFRRRVRNPIRGIIRRLIRWLKNRLHPDPTPEQRALQSEKKTRLELNRVLLEDARTAESRMINRMTSMGLRYEYKKRDGTFGRFATIRFDRIRYEPNAIWYHVDSAHLPDLISIPQLTTKEITDNLSVATGHAVSCKYDVEKGIWYVMERASGTMGIPNHVQLTDMWERLPTSKDSLTIPLGLGNNSRPRFESISDLTHVLVAGSTNSGKSNFVNVVICTLLKRNNPDQLKMILVDLKGGMEFSWYSGLPHLLPVGEHAPDGIVRDRDHVAPVLHWIILEGERRMATFTAAGAKNIAKYNAHRNVKLPRILVVIDEWADVMYSKKKRETEEALVNVVQRMRAVGIHVILCTQIPKSEVLTNLVKSNLPAKFAFNTTTNHGSMAILDNAHSHNLFPRGRCIFQFQDEVTLQTPYISDLLVRQVVEAAIAGKTVEIAGGHDVTPEEIIAWSLANNGGDLQQRQVHNAFKERGISQIQVKTWLAEWEKKEFVIGSTAYRVEPDNGGNRPRHLVAIEDTGTTTEDEEKHDTKNAEADSNGPADPVAKRTNDDHLTGIP